MIAPGRVGHSLTHGMGVRSLRTYAPCPCPCLLFGMCGIVLVLTRFDPARAARPGIDWRPGVLSDSPPGVPRAHAPCRCLLVPNCTLCVQRFADPGQWRLARGVLPFLGKLRARGLRLGVVDNCDTRLRPILEHHGIIDAVDEVVLSCEVGWVKPDDQIFRLACSWLEVKPARHFPAQFPPFRPY